MSGRFDDTLVAEIRNRNNIVGVIGDYVSLRKAGNSYKGLCPFHQENSPSFTVNEARGFYYCFGCQASGDVISFVRELHGYSFVEALRHLADRSGVAVPEARGDWQGVPADPVVARAQAAARRENKRQTKDTFFRLGRAATRFYADTLAGLEGRPCRAYLRDRGINAEGIERFAIGFAPDRWDGLGDELSRVGQSLELAEQCGLIGKRKQGQGYYDRFRGRLMFPIRDLAGEVIAFGGRVVPGTKSSEPGKDGIKPGKYINSPDTPVYTKGKTLFGLYEARKSIRQSGEVIMVEGNLDVVKMAQAGLTNVVAPMGTALTQEQCQLMRRFVSRVVMIYDGDTAGRAAALKAIPLAMSAGLQVGIVALPADEDPDSLLDKEGVEGLKERLSESSPGWTYLVQQAIEHADVRRDPMSGIPRVIDQVVGVLDGLSDRRERVLCQRHLATALGLDESTLNDFLRDARRSSPLHARTAGQPADQTNPQPERAGPPPSELELRLLLVMLLEPSTRPLYRANDAGRFVASPVVRESLDALSSQTDEDAVEVDAVSFVAGLNDQRLREHLFRALTLESSLDDGPAEFERIMNRLQMLSLRRRRNSLVASGATEQTDEEASWRQLLADKRNLERQIERLKGT